MKITIYPKHPNIDQKELQKTIYERFKICEITYTEEGYENMCKIAKEVYDEIVAVPVECIVEFEGGSE